MMDCRVFCLIWCALSTFTVATTKTQTDGQLLHNLPPNERSNQGWKDNGWSRWSEWSPCSRSCDGGVSHQLRRCQSPRGCKGETQRYKICNVQSCPDSTDFRAQQCSAYDNVPYEGKVYKWIPHYDNYRPCALTCRGQRRRRRLSQLSVGESADVDGGAVQQSAVTGAANGQPQERQQQEDEDEPRVIVQLADRVQDGTRCGNARLDMCIQGECQLVGCDFKIGSAKVLDVCGVCGGDNSTCSQLQYQWILSEDTPCAVSCGGGYKIPKPTCILRKSGTAVAESFCSDLFHPEPTVVPCNTHLCPSKWLAEEWSVCSKTCGRGIRERVIVCTEEMNGIKTRVADEACQEPKLPTKELCNVHECPTWQSSEWSGCSVSCGKGIQLRHVECVAGSSGDPSAHCEPQTKPPAMQSCSTGISCRKYELKQYSKLEDDADMEGDEPYPEPRTLSLTQRHERTPRNDRLVSASQQKIPNEATFILDVDWGPCSVSCGEGIRKRLYRCKIYLEFSRTTPTLNDTLCPGPKPADEVEKCYLDPCSMSYGYDPAFPRDSHSRNDFKVQAAVPGKTYSWHEQGYTSCTASCLGGVEELIINCVRDDTGKVVSPFLCSQETKPEARVRTCNDHQCPPRWNMSDFSPCSKSCGIGIKTREVQCIHEVARGGENTMTVPHSMCPQPMPSDRQYCNVLDCPVRWEVSEWGKCSRNCGGGYKERRVECKQIMAQEHKVERPESMCPGGMPASKKSCNQKPCAPESQRPLISANNSTYIQHDQRKAKVSLKVGGAAEVFYGVQVRVKCPVKGRFNRTRIHWTKDGSFLVENRRVKVSSKGALRVSNITYRDSGVYSCHAGLSVAQLNVTVKPKVGDNVSINEYEKYRAAVEIRRNNPKYEAVGRVIDEENPRHRNKPKNRQKNIQQTDARGDESAFKSVSASDSTFTNHVVSSGTKAMPMPHLKQLLTSLQFLLWPFQSFSNSRGYNLVKQNSLTGPVTAAVRGRGGGPDKLPISRNSRMADNDYDEDNENVEELKKLLGTSVIRMKSAPDASSSSSSKLGGDNKLGNSIHRNRPLDWRLGQRINALMATTTTTGDSPSIVLGQGSAKDLKFEWLITPWSECSQSCGMGAGFRMRSAHCVVRLNNVSESVENALCEASGLELPDTMENCGGAGAEGCAEWVAEEWQPCFNSKCVAWHAAVQRRPVYCARNGTRTEDERECRGKDRPPMKRECYSEKCKAVWRPTAWSECEGVCGRYGARRRTIKCVWYGTKKAAGELCKNLPAPLMMQPCKVPSCPQASAATADDYEDSAAATCSAVPSVLATSVTSDMKGIIVNSSRITGYLLAAWLVLCVTGSFILC